jgi:hypothetical protein
MGSPRWIYAVVLSPFASLRVTTEGLGMAACFTYLRNAARGEGHGRLRESFGWRRAGK